MAFERLTIKKVYYYIICAVTLVVLMWGTVDIVSSMLSLTIFKPPSLGLEAPTGPQGGGAGANEGQAAGPSFDEYYQSRMSMDRIGDSIARILVAGIIFGYSGMRIRELEGKEI
jgi:hypothetical protein